MGPILIPSRVYRTATGHFTDRATQRYCGRIGGVCAVRGCVVSVRHRSPQRSRVTAVAGAGTSSDGSTQSLPTLSHRPGGGRRRSRRGRPTVAPQDPPNGYATIFRAIRVKSSRVRQRDRPRHLRGYLPSGSTRTLITTTDKGFAHYSDNGNHVELGLRPPRSPIAYLCGDRPGGTRSAPTCWPRTSAISLSPLLLPPPLSPVGVTPTTNSTLLTNYPLRSALKRTPGQDHPGLRGRSP